MTDIRAVVFDMDGVIIDTRELISQAIADVLASRGLSTTPEQIAAVTGKPVRAMYEVFAPGHDAGELEAAHMAHHEENIHLLRDYPDAAATLAQLKETYKLGIFTGFNELSRERLSRFDLVPYFETIVDTTRYVKHKPDPEGLMLCLNDLEVSPEQAVYVGDGVSDMLAGKAAGVHAVIGITQGFGSREALEANGADYIIDSLSELPSLLTKLSTSGTV